MDSNSSPQSYHLSERLYLTGGASTISPGDYILVRLPVPIDLGSLGTDIGPASGLPPTSTGSHPEYFAFVKSVSFLPDRSVELEVYPQLSFTQSGGALSGYNTLDDAARATLIPLPPLSSRHSTPESFGAPLTISGWSSYPDAWLRVIPVTFILPSTRPFKRMLLAVALSVDELYQIEIYRAALRATTTTIDSSGGQDPSGNGTEGTGRKGGGGSRRKKEPGDKGGQGTSTSGSRFKERWAGWRKKMVVGVGQQEFKIGVPSGDLPVHEGVDEDAQGDNATWKEQLMLLASYGDDDGIWKEGLVKVLRAECKEQEEMKQERMARLGNWRQMLPMT